jgi:hypothetical protein
MRTNTKIVKRFIFDVCMRMSILLLYYYKHNIFYSFTHFAFLNAECKKCYAR